MYWYTHPDTWSFLLRAYLPRLTICSLIWEVLQLPLYTLAQEPRWELIAYAVAHCTVGDAMIGTISLILALTLSRAGHRRNWHGIKICSLSIGCALIYTVFSERMNLVRGSWSYSASMPLLPWIEVGLSPLLQWIIVPSLAWWWANGSARWTFQNRME